MVASIISPSSIKVSAESDRATPKSALFKDDQTLRLNRVACYHINQQVKLLHLQAETDALLHQLEILSQRKQF